MKNVCNDLREHLMKIINFKRIKMFSLTEKEQIFI